MAKKKRKVTNRECWAKYRERFEETDRLLRSGSPITEHRRLDEEARRRRDAA